MDKCEGLIYFQIRNLKMHGVDFNTERESLLKIQKFYWVCSHALWFALHKESPVRHFVGFTYWSNILLFFSLTSYDFY